MSNVLKVSHQEAIRSLHEKGWSQRRIARELGINGRTVRRYIQGESKCTTISTPGSSEESNSKCTDISTPGSERVVGRESVVSVADHLGRKSRCSPFEAAIDLKMQAGLSAQRIYQDLVEENGFSGSYQSVKRFVRRLRARQPERVWRIECQPGEEMQVDFGLGAPIEQGDGKTRRSWVLRVVLSYSRKGYSEAVMHQDTESFLRCLENALRHFDGVPLLLNLDNLKAAVLKADWFDPQINPKLAEFCRHYHMHLMPCRPRMPQHKGKVERGVSYVRDNALKGRRFKSLAEQNAFLSQWEENVADKRIHGTTCKQVAARFEEERPHLQPLPPSLFPCYQEARRNVSRDSFVEVQRAFYEAPPEYIGRQVWVRWDSRCVRIFNDRMEQVQIHLRLEPGKFSRILGVVGMSAPVLSSCRWWRERAALLGEACGQWAQEAIDRRGPEALRSIMGLCNLVKKHTAATIDAACRKALKAGARRLKDIQRLLGESSEQGNFAFAHHHHLIRDLRTYSDFISSARSTQL
jgi:transposase